MSPSTIVKFEILFVFMYLDKNLVGDIISILCRILN